MRTIRDDDGGASTVLAVILMMGFVAAASVSLLVVGTATVDQSKDTAQEQQVENTFRQFNKDVSSVAFGRQKYRSMEFDIQDQTAAFRQENTGRIRVVIDGNEIVDEQVGSLVYEQSGETIAYQAGGVWRGAGEDSRMVSRPPVEYQNGSLTFPIPALDGDESVQAGQLNINKRKTESPINNVGYVEGKLVTLYITSKYYEGWAQYFRTQTNDVAVEVDNSPAGDKGTVKVKLGKPVANGDFDDGVLATGGDSGDICIDNKDSPDSLAATGEIYSCKNNKEADGKENVESNLYELDSAIKRKVQNAEDVVADGTDTSIKPLNVESVSNKVTAGTYYDSDGFSIGDSVEFDLSSGNITLIVDGDMAVDKGSIDVTGTSSGHALRIYSTGNFGMQNGGAGASKSAGAEHFQIYGTSDMLVAITGGDKSQFVGTVYAPRSEPVLSPSGEGGEANPAVVGGGGSHCDGWDMCVATGSAGLTGAVVGGPTYMGQATSVKYDESLDSVKPTLQLDDGVLPPPITFLKVSVHTVAVNNSGANNIQPAGGLGAPASVVSPPSTPTTTPYQSSTTGSRTLAAPVARRAPVQ
ncbi:hypothetical protein [Halorubellus sp. PRR65]|uniref:DUF7289 family protein n=1 Tax=Halorubellus sp. PRR65 TaxID=3098148 RepID=UPI002B258164|nr:hypothetical protein [Halorubellus sp. PRR65]